MKNTKVIKVLVAEDQEIPRAGLIMVLKGFSDIEILAETCDGEQAIEKSVERKPDLVLMDIMMPIKDGIEATKILKQRLPEVKVVMFTTYSRDEDIFAAFSAGADGYCLKDASSQQLYSAIHSAASGAAWLDPGIADRVLRACRKSHIESPTERIARKAKDPFELSEREIDVLKLVVEGLSNQEIGTRLSISPETVKTHMRHLMEKLQVSDRTQAAVKAMRDGLI